MRRLLSELNYSAQQISSTFILIHKSYQSPQKTNLPAEICSVMRGVAVARGSSVRFSSVCSVVGRAVVGGEVIPSCTPVVLQNIVIVDEKNGTQAVTVGLGNSVIATIGWAGVLVVGVWVVDTAVVGEVILGVAVVSVVIFGVCVVDVAVVFVDVVGVLVFGVAIVDVAVVVVRVVYVVVVGVVVDGIVVVWRAGTG